MAGKTQIIAPLDPVDTLKQAHPALVQQVVQFRDETTLVVPPAQVLTVLHFLRDTPGLIYNFLSDISAVDYWEPTGYGDRPGRYGVSYHLYSLLYNRRLRVKVYLDEDDPSVPTASGIWPNANWFEREAIDMMGITFTNHPDPRRILMPDDWMGHPHRRDYPLGYETPQFSFNVEEIMKHKPSARE
jgi:NADH-quinone oxidoreductase subunit C